MFALAAYLTASIILSARLLGCAGALQNMQILGLRTSSGMWFFFHLPACSNIDALLAFNVLNCMLKSQLSHDWIPVQMTLAGFLRMSELLCYPCEEYW